MTTNTPHLAPKPRIALSQRVDRVDAIGETRDGLDQNLARWLAHCGALAYPVPNGLAAPELDAWLAALAPAAVVLSGGNDLGACPERDATESRLLDWAASRCLPLLGICRGMQMMGVAAGGALQAVAGHVRTRHRFACAGLPEEVNSFHNWSLAGCPPGYRVLAAAEDGAPEAMRHETLPWEGWMWHPERETPFAAADRARFQALLGAPTNLSHGD